MLNAVDMQESRVHLVKGPRGECAIGAFEKRKKW